MWDVVKLPKLLFVFFIFCCLVSSYIVHNTVIYRVAFDILVIFGTILRMAQHDEERCQMDAFYRFEMRKKKKFIDCVHKAFYDYSVEAHLT